jgi:hypothetical protein
MNMEKVEDDSSQEVPSAPQATATGTQAAAQEPELSQTLEQEGPSEQEQVSDEVDFSALEADMEDNPNAGSELADEFSFADTSQPVEDEPSEETDVSITEEPPAEEQTDFGAAFEETEETGEGLEFDFNEPAEDSDASSENDAIDFSDASSSDSTEESDDLDFSTDASQEPSGFSFDDNEEESSEQSESGEFSFGDDGDGVFDDSDSGDAPSEEAPTDEPGEFSFDEDEPFGEDSDSAWDEGGSGEDTSFDFDEPQFDSEDAPGENKETGSEDGGLQFGEIDFAGDSDDGGTPAFDTNDDFSQASMEQKEEPESFSQNQESTPPPSPRDDDDDDLLPPPPAKKKSSLSRILLLLILLLVVLGGAAGFLFVQEGSVSLNTVVRYLPFLQDYIGEAPTSSPGDQIGINITGSSYVNGQAGQMLVIQGAAVNNHPTTRSAITVKGVLVDGNGKTLLQQTVFCGNQLSDKALKTMPFASIEEAMNNQFGDSLSNMNVAAGSAIPFTIVFRNLPAGIANINVEVVDSKPGAG